MAGCSIDSNFQSSSEILSDIGENPNRPSTTVNFPKGAFGVLLIFSKTCFFFFFFFLGGGGGGGWGEGGQGCRRPARPARSACQAGPWPDRPAGQLLL